MLIAPRLRADLKEGVEIKLSQMGEVSVPQFKDFYPLVYVGATGETDEMGFPKVWVVSYGGKLPVTQSYDLNPAHSTRCRRCFRPNSRALEILLVFRALPNFW
jgi:hypothetical protein